jgi:hypothetical protein
MANLWKMLDWFRGEVKSAEGDGPAPESPKPTEEPAFELFPEESGGQQRSTDRRQLGVEASLVAGAFTNPDPIRVRDISAGGLYFFAAYRLAPGQRVEVRLTEPDTQQKVCYHANVVRTENTGENQFGVAARITRREILGK